MRIAIGAGTPATISPVVKVPDSAITGPTDKSIPPVRITQEAITLPALLNGWTSP